MNKAILVIDMPKCCKECSICASWQSSAFSIREYWCTTSDNMSVDPDDKPGWCPLKPLPEKYDMENYVGDRDYNGDFEYGYNQCIDEILGG